MNPILFLDIDDVICLNERYSGFDVVLALDPRLQRNDDVLMQVFNRDSCATLRQLHESLNSRIRYVISSTWREALSREQLQTAFRVGGLDFVADALHENWCTPVGMSRASREADIVYWLGLHHSGEAFAILDDEFSGVSLKYTFKDPNHEFYGRVVLCREHEGLLPEHLGRLRLALDWCPPAQGDVA